MQVIVCESRGAWSAALRRQMPDTALPIRSARSLAECAVHLLSAPASVVIAELGPKSGAELFDRVANWRRSNRATEVVVVAARSLASWNEIVLEAGASLFVTSPRRLGDVATLIHRHADRHPQPTTATADRIWAELPLSATP